MTHWQHACFNYRLSNRSDNLMMNYNLKNYYDWPILPRAAIIGLACVLLFLLAYRLDFSSLQKRFTIVQQQQNDLKNQLQAIFKNQAELYADLAKEAELNKTLSVLQGKLVSKNNIPEALNEILKIGSANGLQFSSFNPDKEELESIYTKVPIKVIAIGSYDQIGSFLDQIAHMTPLITINNFTIQRPQKTTTSTSSVEVQQAPGSLVSELLLEAYYLNSEVSHESKK